MRFFNDLAEIEKTQNHLPHWQQEGSTYFVTWRLKDSIPRDVLERLINEKSNWERSHPKPWTDKEEAEYHNTFSKESDRLMDMGFGECVLRHLNCRDALANSLSLFDSERFLMHSWVAMPNHVHVLISLVEGGSLEKVIGGWKGYSSKDINVVMGNEGSLWQKDYFDRIIRDWEHMFRVAKYIRRNPEKAKLRDGEFTLYEAE
jgi:REP element-mobilizing transposase RayT